MHGVWIHSLYHHHNRVFLHDILTPLRELTVVMHL